MPRRERILLLMLWATLMLVACQLPALRAAPTLTPVRLPPTAATPIPKGPMPVDTPPPMANSAAVLADTLRRLDTAIGYRYNITATLSYIFEGKPVEWTYTGQGASAHPERKFEWAVEGQVDVSFRLVNMGTETICRDTRGAQTEGCNLAWGGPSPGASPYTAIAYLRFAEEIGELRTARIADRDYYTFEFSPSLAKLASLDAAHQQAIRPVTKASGEAWVDKSTGFLRRVQMTIVSVTPAGREQHTVLTLTFFDFGQPVEIRLPETRR